MTGAIEMAKNMEITIYGTMKSLNSGHTELRTTSE